MKSLIITLLLIPGIIAISGCCPDKGIVIPPAKVNCPAPQRPVLAKTQTYDPKIFFTNFADLVEYSLILEGTVKCYNQALSAETVETRRE
ncbi:MAG: hypothetical protein WCJ37_01035 [Syntrophus sp. (in: bacteria)]